MGFKMAVVSVYIWIALFCFTLNFVPGQLECTEPDKPVFMPTKTDLTGDEGTSLTLPCVFKNIPQSFRVYWYAGAENIYWNDRQQSWVKDIYEIAYSITNTTRSSNLTIKSLSPYDPLKYICRATSSPGGRQRCTNQAEFNVTVNYKPIVHFIGPREAPYGNSEEPGKIFVNETDNITLVCNASGEPAPLIHWKKEGMNEYLSPPTRETLKLVLTNVLRTQSGNYSCQATNKIDHRIGYVQLVVQYAPEVTSLQSDVRAAPGSSITIGCDFVANPEPFDIYWMKDGVKVPGRGSSPIPNRLVILKLDPKTDYGTYTCVARNQVGTASATVEVSGRPLAPVILNNDPQGRYRHKYNLTWCPARSNLTNRSQALDIPIARYVIKYQRKDIQNIEGSLVTVLWPNEPLSETVQGRQEYIILRDLKENSSYEGFVCPESDYGFGDCVFYTFKTSIVDYPSPLPVGYTTRKKCLGPDDCGGTWTPPTSTAKRHSTVAVVIFTACVISWSLTV